MMVTWWIVAFSYSDGMKGKVRFVCGFCYHILMFRICKGGGFAGSYIALYLQLQKRN